MKIPYLPICPINLEDKDDDFLYSLKGKVDKIDAIRIEDDLLNVLGTKGFFNEKYFRITQNRISKETTEISFTSPDSGLTALAKFFTLGLYCLSTNAKQKEKAQRDYDDTIELYKSKNLKDITDRVHHIKVYQGTINEVQKELGRALEMVNTNRPETFLHARDTFWLRVRAYQFGADAVVHYQPGSAIGTPVRYKEKK